MEEKYSQVASRPEYGGAKLESDKTSGFARRMQTHIQPVTRRSECSDIYVRVDRRRSIDTFRLGWSVNEIARVNSAVLGTLTAIIMVIGVSAPLGADERSTRMWGAGPSGAGGKESQLASSTMHVNYGVVAGQVNAARDGLLYQGTSITITSIGSQNVISTTIYGDNNRVDVDADQDSSNSGDVSNNGTINIQRGALEN